MRILAIDLGKFKSVACDYDTAGGEPSHTTISTTPRAFHDLLVEREPDRLVIEVGGPAGWVHDLARALEVEVKVANPNHESWRGVKRKTDRRDALKLARLEALDQLPTVHMPEPGVRQWRSLIAYRGTLVDRRTAIKNHIRAILDRQGLGHPGGRAGWNEESMGRLWEMAAALDQAAGEGLWRGILREELGALEEVQPRIERVEAKLNALAAGDGRVRRLRTVPGVGPRLAELVVAMIDDPHRFAGGRQVGAYAGLVPRENSSGTQRRLGRITQQGSGLLRKLLVEVAWGMRRHNDRAAAVFERLCRGQKTRRKQAVVAVARKVLIWCWAMLRDERDWDPAAAA